MRPNWARLTEKPSISVLDEAELGEIDGKTVYLGAGRGRIGRD
ncbi:hypothetical protein [Paenibacillus roseipurpureus]|uniref:Uncharacterized protein n=1 Tax=Paenibacillus roseopurpureus TaxID=2918901 RepID=A0AA96RJC0_9BACL|nr:hypothetical protein [Paenibacillus sp. MBLB1832]WNR43144.1 hypothetical protein MJB10_18770 [Paenibacillus sp. MBLB1832]